jgi:hypothetical protein
MKKTKLNLQLFAAGENNEQAVRSYQLEFKKMLQVVFKKQSYFADFFGGSIEALDGVQENETAFRVKTSDIPCVVGSGYNTEVELGKGSRFGDMTEVVYTNAPVEYTWGWNWHEGIDRYTVNNDFNAAVADRLELQARAKTQLFNSKHGAFISASAGKTEELKSYSADDVLALFNALSKYYTDIEAVGERVAKVTPELYNAIVDHPLTTSAKGSGANIDSNGIIDFKGFKIDKIPSKLFGAGDCCYIYIPGVGKAFTGINTARTIEAVDFDGKAFQGAGKAGEYILPANKKAVVKVTIASA